MPAVRVLYDVEGWAFHRRALALQRHAPPDVRITLGALPRVEDAARALGDDPVDLVFALPGRKAGAVRAALRARRWPALLVVGWNIGWPQWRDEFATAHAVADAVVFNNRIYWEQSGRPPRTHVIANGVDLDTFRVITPPAERPPRALWVGSEFHRAVKGYDDVLPPLRRALVAGGIDCDFRLVDSRGPHRLGAEAMAAWYNTGRVLVCTSSSEGTPNVALEAAACGCAVVSTPVGNMPELIRDGWNGYLVARDPTALAAAVHAACRDYPRLAAAMGDAIRTWDWRESCRRHYELFARLCRARDPGARRD